MSEFRLMTQDDVMSVLDVQAHCYAVAMQEDETTLRTRLATAPQSAWVAVDAAGVCAYLVAYPSSLGKITPLGACFDLTWAPDSLYLHDLAVSARAKGKGLGPALVRLAWSVGRDLGLGKSTLVSVQQSQGFWRRLGYEPVVPLQASQAANLATYLGVACYMARSL